MADETNDNVIVPRVNGRIQYKYRYIYIYIHETMAWQPVTNLLEGLHADFLPIRRFGFDSVFALLHSLSRSLDMNNDTVHR